MKKKLRKYTGRVLSVFLASIFMMSGLMFIPPENNAYAAGGVITNVVTVKDDYGKEPQFTINDELGTHTGICINFNAKIPGAGAAVSSPVLSTNDALRRVLYYGNGGPGDLGVYGWTFTAMAASSAIGNIPMKDGQSVGDHYTLSLFAQQPVPPSTFKVYIVSTSDSAYQPMAYWINEPQGAAYIQKSSANPTITTGNDCYSLKNAIYGIYSSSSYTSTSLVTQLATDENGKTLTAPLDPGTYYVKEITAPKGYLLDTTVYSCVVVSGKTTAVAVKDVPGNDPVSIILTKIDKDTGETVQGAGDLSGAEFTICYYDGYYNASNLPSTHTRKWVIKTSYDSSTGKYATRLDRNNLISGDDFYYNNQNPCLPLGTITIEETKAPVGYTLEGATFTTASGTPVTGKYLTQITSTTSGNGASLVGGNVLTVSDSVIRGDLEVYKTDFETGEAMANVRFKLTSQTTGESHEFVTDENGYYSTATSYIPHTTNTNCGNAGDGIYFGGADADDSQGALPYDTYLLEEIPCEANEGKSMYSGTVEVNTAVTVTKSVANKDLTLKTTATFADGTHYGAVGEDVIVTDIATYEGLTVGEEYTVKGTLMDKATGEALILADGSIVTTEKTFTPSAANGTVEIEFAFNTAGLDGKTVVVFEDLYIEDLKVMSHADINDVDQTIYFPEIGTTLTDTETEGHTALVAEDITLVDTVAYTGLEPGVEHVVTGILMDKATGEPALDDEGNEITAETSFIPETSSGTVEVTFTFSGINLAGTSVVAFETVYKNDREYAVHADIDDEDQSVYFPKVTTTATSGGKHEVTARESVTLVDTVKYENLIPGEEYTLKGTVMDKETGKVLVIDGKAVTAEKTFTAENAYGTVDISFTFNASALAGKSVVVFEKLYLAEGDLIASHEDIDDKGQTVKFVEPPKTGDNPRWILWFAVAFISGGISVITVVHNRKRRTA